MPPAPRLRCCAITTLGARCLAETATEEQLGRCKTHHRIAAESTAVALATTEFGHIVRGGTHRDILGIFFGLRVVPLVHFIAPILNTAMVPWIQANRTVILEFAAARPPGRRVNLVTVLERYTTQIEVELRRLHPVIMGHEQYGPVLRGERAFGVRLVLHAPVAAPRGELAAFAADNQNVHTVQSVTLTTAVVKRVLKVAVPAGYGWNNSEVSKTPGEIIAGCKLGQKAAMQMLTLYCAADTIYELGAGIYGRVLDGVWQYVSESPDKADLCRILKSELTDNVGMCMQGNLTRLCNVLAGYLEGIGSQECPADRLGRELPKLMEIDDVTHRIETARGVLRDTGLPETEWAPWLEALE